MSLRGTEPRSNLTLRVISMSPSALLRVNSSEGTVRDLDSSVVLLLRNKDFSRSLHWE